MLACSVKYGVDNSYLLGVRMGEDAGCSLPSPSLRVGFLVHPYLPGAVAAWLMLS